MYISNVYNMAGIKYVQEERLRGAFGAGTATDFHVQDTLTPRDLRASRNMFNSEAKASFEAFGPHVISTYFVIIHDCMYDMYG